MRFDKICLTLGIISILIFLFPFLSVIRTGFGFFGESLLLIPILIFVLAILTLITGYIGSQRKESENKYLLTGIIMGTVTFGLELFMILFNF